MALKPMSYSFNDEDVTLAVKRGAYWLDENHPQWVDSIDLMALNMSDCSNCVIGQAVGNFFRVLEIQSVFAGCSENEWAEEHGFQSPSFVEETLENEIGYKYSIPLTDSYYTKLETLWSDEVRKRLG